MINVRERIDNRCSRMLRQDFESLLRKNTRHDSLHPARKAASDIGNGFAVTEMRVGVIEINRRPAQAGNTDFECNARAQRWLFKNHCQEPASEGVLVAVRVRLNVRSQTKQLADL